MRQWVVGIAFASVLTLAMGAHAQEAAPGLEDAAPADIELGWAGASIGGLTGFGEVVTTTVVPPKRFRLLLSLQHQQSQLSPNNATVAIEDRAQVYHLMGAVGIIEGLEASLMIPIIDWEQSNNFGLGIHNQGAGIGNPELGVKYRVPLEMERITLASYVRLQLPIGERDILRPKRFVLEGDAASITTGTFLNTLRLAGGGEFVVGAAIGVQLTPMASLFMDLAYRDVEGGSNPDQFFRYRLGVAVDPLPNFGFGVYLDGEEFEGAAGSNLFVGFGLTALAGPAVIGAGFEILIVDDGYDRLIFGSGAGDEFRYWSFTLTTGAAF